MNDSERIQALEQEIRRLYVALDRLSSNFVHHLGAASVYHGAVGSLIESHQDLDRVLPILEHMYAELYAHANGESNNEAYLEGMRIAQVRLAESLRIRGAPPHSLET